MVTPPFNDPLSTLQLADTFYTWFRRTNDLVTKVNPIQVYGITTDTDGLSVIVDGQGIATISSVIPYYITGEHDFTGGITFSGSPIRFHAPAIGTQQIIFDGNATVSFELGVDVFFLDDSSVTFATNCDVNFNAIAHFNNDTHFNENDDGIATFHGDVAIGVGTIPSDRITDVVIGTDSYDRLQVFSGTSFENHVVFTDSVTHHPATGASKNFQNIDNIVTFGGSDVSFSGDSTVDCYVDATFHDDVNMADTSTLRLGGVVWDKADDHGQANDVLTSDGAGHVRWTAQSGGGGGDGNGEIASKIVSKTPINWHTKSAQNFMLYMSGDNNQPNNTSENIGNGDPVTKITTRHISDFGIPEDATHIIIGGQMTLATGAMESLEYNTGQSPDSSTSRTIVRISAAGGSDGAGANAEVIVPIGSDGWATIWINGDIDPINQSQYVRHAWVAGYIIPASAAATSGDSSTFIIDNQYFPDDASNPNDSDTYPAADRTSWLGTMIAQAQTGPGLGESNAGYMSTGITCDASLRGSNAMLSVSGSIEQDPRRRHKWEFWVSTVGADETAPPTDANGKKWSKIVTTSPENSIQWGVDRFHDFSIDIPMIDIPMSGPIYLNSRVVTEADLFDDHGDIHFQNQCWGRTYTWYGGGVGGGVGGGSVVQGTLALQTFTQSKDVKTGLAKPLYECTDLSEGNGEGLIDLVVDFRGLLGVPSDATHVLLSAYMQAAVGAAQHLLYNPGQEYDSGKAFVLAGISETLAVPSDHDTASDSNQSIVELDSNGYGFIRTKYDQSTAPYAATRVSCDGYILGQPLGVAEATQTVLLDRPIDMYDGVALNQPNWSLMQNNSGTLTAFPFLAQEGVQALQVSRSTWGDAIPADATALIIKSMMHIDSNGSQGANYSVTYYDSNTNDQTKSWLLHQQSVDSSFEDLSSSNESTVPLSGDQVTLTLHRNENATATGIRKFGAMIVGYMRPARVAGGSSTFITGRSTSSLSIEHESGSSIYGARKHHFFSVREQGPRVIGTYNPSGSGAWYAGDSPNTAEAYGDDWSDSALSLTMGLTILYGARFKIFDLQPSSNAYTDYSDHLTWPSLLDNLGGGGSGVLASLPYEFHFNEIIDSAGKYIVIVCDSYRHELNDPPITTTEFNWTATKTS